MVLAALLLIAPAGPARAAPPAPDGCAQPTGVYTGDEPWPQRLLDPGRVWPLTTGDGVLVAVLGTGVDARNAQFAAGQVRPGAALVGASSVTRDCDGRGTVAAGIIAARPNPVTTFVGLAPDADILAVRYTQATTQGGAGAAPDLVAGAIRSAVDAHANVICVLLPASADSPTLRAAVAAATAADAVVISPAVAGRDGNAARSYPTGDPQTLAVGAIGPTGEAVSAESGDNLTVSAPGSDLVGTAAGVAGTGHAWPVNDPSYAAAYVAGVAALVRSYRPSLTAAEVRARIARTAVRSASDGHDPRLGWGVVDLYAAVTAEGVDGAAPTASRAVEQRVAPARPQPPAPRAFAAMLAALAGLASAGLIGLGALVVRRGRARGWRSGLPEVPPGR